MLTKFYKKSSENRTRDVIPSTLARDISTENNDMHLPTHKDSQPTNKIIHCDSDFFKNSTSTSLNVPGSYKLLEFEKRNLKCPQCSYITDRKNNLKRHIVTMHQECPKTLDCCGVVFRSKAALREHVSFHHRGGYRCQICGRNFCRKALLRRHLTVHSGQKDYRCDHCTYATSHKSNLERHQKVHQRTDSHRTNEPSLYGVFHERMMASKEPKISPVSGDDEQWNFHPNFVQKETYEHQNYDHRLTFAENMRRQMLQGTDLKSDDFSLMFRYSLTDFNQNDIEKNQEKDDNVNSKYEVQFDEPLKEFKAQTTSQADDFNENFLNRNSWFYYPCENNFSSYVKDRVNSNDCIDENENNMKELSNLENLESHENENRKVCQRLSQKPYKCFACGASFTNQSRFLRHVCRKAVRVGFYFPVTNMVKKGVALAEIKNNMAIKQQQLKKSMYTYVL